MLARGWCPHQVNYLAQIYDLQTFSYLATLNKSSQRTADHGCCLDHASCIAYNTNMATYEIRHTSSDCTCPIILTPYDELVQIIRKGGIPLIDIKDPTRASGEQFQIAVRKREREHRYTAISHVWADGLGNPNDNGLPLCQIKQLHTHLEALGQSHEVSCFPPPKEYI